jgi:hypothetical protein
MTDIMENYESYHDMSLNYIGSTVENIISSQYILKIDKSFIVRVKELIREQLQYNNHICIYYEHNDIFEKITIKLNHPSIKNRTIKVDVMLSEMGKNIPIQFN